MRLKYGGETLTQPVQVVRHPEIAATAADLLSQFRLLSDVRDRIEETHDAVARNRDVRSQIQATGERAEKLGKGTSFSQPGPEIEPGVLNFPPALDHQFVGRSRRSRLPPMPDRPTPRGRTTKRSSGSLRRSSPSSRACSGRTFRSSTRWSRRRRSRRWSWCPRKQRGRVADSEGSRQEHAFLPALRSKVASGGLTPIRLRREPRRAVADLPGPARRSRFPRSTRDGGTRSARRGAPGAEIPSISGAAPDP